MSDMSIEDDVRDPIVGVLVTQVDDDARGIDVRVVRFTCRLAMIRELLDCDLVDVIRPVGDEPWSAYVDDEALFNHHQDNKNYLATHMAQVLGWKGITVDGYLHGPVLFVGVPDDEGNDTTVDGDVLAALSVVLGLAGLVT